MNYENKVESLNQEIKVKDRKKVELTGVKKIESLNNLYLNEGISVKWIVIGNTDFQIAENYNRRGAGLRLLCGRGGGYGAVFIHNSFVCKV